MNKFCKKCGECAFVLYILVITPLVILFRVTEAMLALPFVNFKGFKATLNDPVPMDELLDANKQNIKGIFK